MHFFNKDNITETLLDQKRLKADVEADQVIDDVVDEHGINAAKEIFRTLIREVDLPVDKLPENIRVFIKSNYFVPGWADTSKVKLAQEVFIDHGPKFLMFLYFKSLPLLYSMKNGVQVLVKTGRLAYEPGSDLVFTRRIAETGQFLLEVMSPGAFTNDKTGITMALKVRLIHASIRHFIGMGQWGQGELGKPINQEDLAATLMTFSASMIEGLQQFHIPVSAKEADAYQHCWKIIGHTMGIDGDLLPENAEDGKYLLQKILSRQSQYSGEGVLMAKALLSFVKKQVGSGILASSPNVLIRFLTGKEISDRIGVRRDRFWWLYYWLPAFLRTWFHIGESLEDKVNALETFADKASQKLVHTMVGYFDTYKQRNFQIPPALNHKWKLE